MNQQIEMFPEQVVRSERYVALPKYRVAFPKNDWYMSAVALFLLEKGDWTYDLTNLKEFACRPEGYIIILAERPKEYVPKPHKDSTKPAPERVWDL